MPPTPIPVNYGIFTTKYLRTGSSQPLVCTFGFHNIPSNDATTNATDLGLDWIGDFTPGITLDDYTWIGANVLQNVGGTLQSGDYVASIAGTVAADAVSPAVAAVITKRTLFAGRKYRGRAYLPPALLAEANVDDAGVIDGATLTSLQNAATAFLADANTSNLPLYLLHHDLSTPDAITSLDVRNSVRTQRRRQKLS